MSSAGVAHAERIEHDDAIRNHIAQEDKGCRTDRAHDEADRNRFGAIVEANRTHGGAGRTDRP